ncbi:MAG: ribosome hibernation-promoting factor, HPF/YfiA family [Pyrinomonadaceae bacterium]
MKFEYSGRHIEVTPAIRSHVETHFERIDHIFGTRPIRAHVIIEVERGRSLSEIVVNWRNDVLTATTRNADMYKSLSMSIDKIEKQALKLKNKVIDRSHKAKKAGTSISKKADGDGRPASNRIVNEKRYAVKPVLPEEAALMLKNKKDNFLVFRNAETEKISVIYQRSDGNFGLIEP